MSNFNNGGLGDGGLSKSREKSATFVNSDGIVFGSRNLMKLVTDNMQVSLSEDQPAGGTKLDVEVKADMALINDGLSKILADITAKEEECLRIIHTRYCIPRALKINVTDLRRLQPDNINRPNYWEYFYRYGTPNEYFLMSREVAIINGEVKLNIIFNEELARDGE